MSSSATAPAGCAAIPMGGLAPPATPSRAPVWRKSLLLLLALLLVGAAFRWLPGGFSRDRLVAALAVRGASGAAILVLAGGLLSAIGVPRQVVAFVCGYAAGVWYGAVLGMAAQMLGCAADFAWARGLARDWVARRMRGRIARIDGFLAARPFTATVSLRLLPVGNNLALNLLAGVSGIATLPFLLGTAVGYLPQTLIFTLIGSGVHVARGVQLALGVALFVLSGMCGALLLRRGGRAEPGLAGAD